jgi:hypothetical protein
MSVAGNVPGIRYLKDFDRASNVIGCSRLRGISHQDIPNRDRRLIEHRFSFPMKWRQTNDIQIVTDDFLQGEGLIVRMAKRE